MDCLNLEVLHGSREGAQIPDDELTVQSRCAELLGSRLVAGDD